MFCCGGGGNAGDGFRSEDVAGDVISNIGTTTDFSTHLPMVSS